jgi:hypothetical protein
MKTIDSAHDLMFVRSSIVPSVRTADALVGGSRSAALKSVLMPIFNMKPSSMEGTVSFCPQRGLSTLGGLTWGYSAPSAMFSVLSTLAFLTFLVKSTKCTRWPQFTKYVHKLANCSGYPPAAGSCCVCLCPSL